MSIRSSTGPAPRFVGVFDVLGFRAMLQSEGLATLASRYRAFEKEIRELSRWEVRTAIFSDTILMFGAALAKQDVLRDFRLQTLPLRMMEAERTSVELKDVGDDDYAEIVRVQGDAFMNYAAGLMRRGLALGLPLRAGIAFGDCVIIPSRNIYVGQPVVDAYLTEERQDWLGIALHESCFSVAGDPSPGSPFGRLVRWSEIPVKNGSPLTWTLNWMQDARTRLIEGRECTAGSPLQARWDAALALFAALERGGSERLSERAGHVLLGPRYDVY